MRLALALAVLLLASACGGADEDGEAGAPPQTDLLITIWPQGEGDGEGEPLTQELRCDPAEGDLPDPAAACARLEAIGEPFAPVPAEAVCTQIYGGPATARVEGSYQGVPVNARFSRENGCEIARWEEHGFLFPGSYGAT